MSRIGKKPIPIPKGVTVKIEGNTVAVQGPKGKLDTALPARHHGRAEGREPGRHPRERFAGGAARTGARAGQQRGRRRDQGLDARTGNRRHRLPRRNEGQVDGGVQPGLLASDRVSAADRRGCDGGSEADQDCADRASTGRRWDRWRRKCARCVRRIRTRTKVSAMRASV